MPHAVEYASADHKAFSHDPDDYPDHRNVEDHQRQVMRDCERPSGQR
jgi:hypothetical protein